MIKSSENLDAVSFLSTASKERNQAVITVAQQCTFHVPSADLKPQASSPWKLFAEIHRGKNFLEGQPQWHSPAIKWRQMTTKNNNQHRELAPLTTMIKFILMWFKKAFKQKWLQVNEILGEWTSAVGNISTFQP